MSSHALKFVLLSSLGLSCFLGNSVAFAQVDGGVVVPTVPSGTSTPTTTPIPTGTPTSTPTSPTAAGTRFSCQSYNGQYTVMYQPESQPGQYFAWAAPAALGGGWDPEKRCATIAQRLELYRPDGLQELQVTRENNENIVCVTTEANSGCRIVLTVPRDKDAYAVRNSIFQNLTTADSGQQTIAVNTYRNNQSGVGDLYNLGRTLLGGNRVSSARSGINLKPFLDRKDGGTASGLKNGVALRSRSNSQTTGRQQPNSVRLDPNRFRR
ncbi:MAG: COP23 domain-containing protein [Aulosira sp. DedQUE10]|nr:COP23 domain-containing protein [Aulosira sp. DedQUE10]